MKYPKHMDKADRYRAEIAEHEARADQYEGYAAKVIGTDKRANDLRESYRRSAAISRADAAKERRNLAEYLGQPVQAGFEVTETGQINMWGDAA